MVLVMQAIKTYTDDNLGLVNIVYTEITVTRKIMPCLVVYYSHIPGDCNFKIILQENLKAQRFFFRTQWKFLSSTELNKIHSLSLNIISTLLKKFNNAFIETFSIFSKSFNSGIYNYECQ
jgi:hypothetical protein